MENVRTSLEQQELLTQDDILQVRRNENDCYADLAAIALELTKDYYKVVYPVLGHMN